MSSQQTPSRPAQQAWAWLSDHALPYVLLLLAGALLAGAGWTQHRAAHEGLDATAARVADAAAQDVAASLQAFDRTLQAVITRHESAALQGLDPQARNAPLFERAQREPYFAFIDVLDENGRSVAGLPRRDRDWGERDYFRVQQNHRLDRPYIGRRFSVESESLVGLTISRRLTDLDGRFTGLVVMGVRLAYFRDLLGRLDLGPHASLLLSQEDGSILMRLPFDLNSIGDTARPGSAFLTSIQAGASSFTAADPIDRVEKRFVVRRVADLPLVVGVGTAVAGQATPILWWMLAAGALLIAGVFLLSRQRWQEARHREAAERESREKSRFLTTLSHELRTPLHGILGYAEQLAREGGLGAEQLRRLTEIGRAGKHMRDVVNVVLDYARIEALGPVMHMQPVDVWAVAQYCLELVEPTARARGLETRLVTSQAPGRFVTDEVQLRQILMNLLSNAVKYTPRGSIELRVAGDAEHLTIEVSDTGIGIPEAQRHHLFQEYERFGAERTSIEGTGLGLAIAHRLVRRMGGHLGHRNNAGGGSVFWLELPGGVANVPEPPAVTAAGRFDRRLSVLVVDDDEINRAVGAAILSQLGHTVTETHDGGEAVRLAARHDFDVVLMDMRMAGMDGLEATRRIRALDGARGQVPIVAVTAHALDQHAEECRRAGMSDHLAKPFTQAELATVVARAAMRGGHPAVDPDALTQLAACMGEGEVQRLLDCLALRIEALLRRLEEPSCAASPDLLADLAHELIGSAGTLGFFRLASMAADFERAVLVGRGDTDAMRGEAMAVLADLRRRRSLQTMLAD